MSENYKKKVLHKLGIILGVCIAFLVICLYQANKEIETSYAKNNQKISSEQTDSYKFENELTKINRIPDKTKRNIEKRRLRLEKQQFLKQLEETSAKSSSNDSAEVKSKVSIAFVYADEDIKEEA